jgi:hypothetical protein
MKQGTISILVGCHSPVHTLYVLKAWIGLYHKMPCFWELVCILLHDIGHYNTNYLDNLDEKKNHWRLGAEIGKKLFGMKAFEFMAGHCEYSGYSQSKLYKPDKISQIHPFWWSFIYQTFEPNLTKGFKTKRESWQAWQKQVKTSISSGEFRGSHEMYLERIRGEKN